MATIGVAFFGALTSVGALFYFINCRRVNMGDFWYIWVLPVVGGIIWYIISTAMVKAPGNVLQQKFIKLVQRTKSK